MAKVFSILSLSLLWIISQQVSAGRGGGKRCPAIEIENGRTRVKARGRIAKFKCRKHYMLFEGGKFATCVKGKWTGKIPKCISTGCHMTPHITNGEVFYLYNDALAQFHCNPGYSLEGSPALICDGFDWNGTVPVCTPPANAARSCGFEEEDLCGWFNGDHDDFDWERNKGSKSIIQAGTGPRIDHTLGTVFGHYMYIDASIPRVDGHKARIYSPVYHASVTDAPSCFGFYYHMFGNTTGHLNVYVKKTHEEMYSTPPSSQISGANGDEWILKLIHLNRQTSDFQIVLEGERGNHYTSDIAIDDVILAQADMCDHLQTEVDSQFVTPSPETTIITTTTEVITTTSQGSTNPAQTANTNQDTTNPIQSGTSNQDTMYSINTTIVAEELTSIQSMTSETQGTEENVTETLPTVTQPQEADVTDKTFVPDATIVTDEIASTGSNNVTDTTAFPDETTGTIKITTMSVVPLTTLQIDNTGITDFSNVTYATKKYQTTNLPYSLTSEKPIPTNAATSSLTVIPTTAAVTTEIDSNPITSQDLVTTDTQATYDNITVQTTIVGAGTETIRTSTELTIDETTNVPAKLTTKSSQTTKPLPSTKTSSTASVDTTELQTTTQNTPTKSEITSLSSKTGTYTQPIIVITTTESGVNQGSTKTTDESQTMIIASTTSTPTSGQDMKTNNPISMIYTTMSLSTEMSNDLTTLAATAEKHKGLSRASVYTISFSAVVIVVIATILVAIYLRKRWRDKLPEDSEIRFLARDEIMMEGNVFQLSNASSPPRNSGI